MTPTAKLCVSVTQNITTTYRLRCRAGPDFWDSPNAVPGSGIQFTNRPCPSSTLFFFLVPIKGKSSCKCNCSLQSMRSIHTVLRKCFTSCTAEAGNEALTKTYS